MNNLPQLPVASIVSSGLTDDRVEIFERYYTTEQMLEFAHQAVKDEREACAKLCDGISTRLAASCKHASDAAKEIRARA